MSLEPDERARAVRAVLLLGAVLMFGVQVLWRGHLAGVDEYDDGVYLGAAVNLVHGILPYKDFVFLQPPGIAVELAPFALAAHVVGTAHAFEAARLFIAAVAIANVWLVGRLLRCRPVPEIVVAMTIMIVHPGALRSAQTVLIEPLLVLWCLLALTALFDGEHVTLSRKRQVIGGLFLGVAVATKVWALAPLIVLAAVVWHATRKTDGSAPALRLLGGAVGAFVAICAPIAGAAPAAFVHDAFVVQATRLASGYSWPERLQSITGTSRLVVELAKSSQRQHAADAVITVGAVLVGLIVASCWRAARPMLPLEVVGVWTSVLIAVSFKFARSFYYHYSGFIVVFLALAATRVVACLAAAARSTNPRAPARLAAGGTILALAFGLTALAVADVATLTSQAPKPPLSAALRASLPKQGCILYLQPAVGLLANRFTTTQVGCPQAVDYLGQERALDRGIAQRRADELAPSLQRLMLQWATCSSAVVVGGMATSWGPQMSAYMLQHFDAVSFASDQVVVYTRVASTSSSP